MRDDTPGDYLPMQLDLALACGRKITLREMTMLDYRDGEKLLERSRPDWFRIDAKTGEVKVDYTTLGVLIWLMARKTDVSRENQLRGKWAFTLDDLLVDFTERDFMRNGSEITSFFLQTQASDTDESGSEPAESSDSLSTTSA